MKKFLAVICVALFGFAAANAQKGDMGVGLNIGFAPCLEKNASLTNFGIGAKFQYNVTDPIRVEADLDYWVKAKGIDMFDITANVHYLFNVTDKIKVYPLVGIGYASVGGGYSGSKYDFEEMMEEFMDWYYDDDDEDDFEYEGGKGDSSRFSRFVFNVGVGGEYAITSKLSVGLEIKYQYVKDFSRMPITIGATYRF